MRRLAVLIGVSAAVLGAAAAGRAAASTKLERWVAFRSGKLAPGVHVVASARAACAGGSAADPRPDAWRCVSGGQVQDPCFSGGGSYVVCPDGTPDSRDALRLTLTRPLPQHRASPPGGGDPWVIETGGLYCYRVTSAAVTYECAGASVLTGRPDRSKPVWTIRLLSTASSRRYRTVPIGAAWW